MSKSSTEFAARRDPQDGFLHLRVPRLRLAAWEDMAARSGAASLSEWVRDTLDRACDRPPIPPTQPK